MSFTTWPNNLGMTASVNWLCYLPVSPFPVPHSPLLSDLLSPLLYHSATRQTPGREDLGRSAGGNDLAEGTFAEFPHTRVRFFGILLMPTRKGACLKSRRRTDFPRRDGRACCPLVGSRVPRDRRPCGHGKRRMEA